MRICDNENVGFPVTNQSKSTLVIYKVFSYREALSALIIEKMRFFTYLFFQKNIGDTFSINFYKIPVLCNRLKLILMNYLNVLVIAFHCLEMTL